MSVAALIGAAAGAALGYLNARFVSATVIRALEATDRSQTEEEKAVYRGKIRLFWLIVHLVFIAGGVVAGIGLARWLVG